MLYCFGRTNEKGEPAVSLRFSCIYHTPGHFSDMVLSGGGIDNKKALLELEGIKDYKE